MAGYYENLGEIHESFPLDSSGMTQLPPSVIDSSPYRIRNIPPDEIVYGGPNTVMRDTATNVLTIDTQDIAQPLPSSEWMLRSNPALMRIFTSLGGHAIDGYIVDLRHVAFFSHRDSGLEDGVHSPVFEKIRQNNATVFPLGVLMNNAGLVRYVGHPELQPSAVSMMQRIDAFVASIADTMPKYPYRLGNLPNAIRRPERLAIENPVSTSEAAPFTNDTPPAHDRTSDETGER